MIRIQSYLMGEWVSAPGKARSLVDPTTEEVIAETGTEGLDLSPALDFARNHGGPALRAMTFAERGALLKAMSKAIHEAREELITVSMRTGTPRGDAKFDIDGASGTLAYYASLGKKLGETRYLHEEAEALTQSPRFWGKHILTPLRGVAVHINAFNFPAWGLAEKAAVALLAGVPVISKPATSTSLLTFRMTEKIVETGALPRGALQLICGGTGDLLEKLGPQDVIAFTGSSDTAQTLRRLESVKARSTRLNVEADSLNVSILGPEAGPGSEVYDRFLRDVAKEMTQKSGQKCTATRRIFVPKARIDQVQEGLIEELRGVVVGAPEEETVRMGPLSTRDQLRDFHAGLEKLKAAGAALVYDGSEGQTPLGAPEGKGFFAFPTLLRADDPKGAAAVHEHEVFGPAATLMPYESVEELAALVAAGGGGLVASVYGDDREALQAIVLEIAPFHGRVLMNTKKIADQAIHPGLVLPSCVHGGPGRAGGGEELGGLRGLRFYTQRTAIQGDRALLDRMFAGGAE